MRLILVSLFSKKITHCKAAFRFYSLFLSKRKDSMFVEGMPSGTMFLEAQRDITGMTSRNTNFLEAHRKEILRSKRFPIQYSSKWKSPFTKNIWNIAITIRDKEAFYDPDIFCYCRFNTRWGVDVIFPTFDVNYGNLSVIHITTHFFMRYRTRYLALHKKDLQGVDVVDEFIQANSMLHFPSQSKIGHFICCVFGGIAFGEYDGNVTRFKTFVSHEMLREMQEKVLHRNIDFQKKYNEFMANPDIQSYKHYELQGRVSSPKGFPSLSQKDIDQFIQQNPHTKRLAEVFYKDNEEEE